MQMGLREANQRFSQLMKAVKQGKEVLLTERGKPLAVVKLIGASDEAGSAIRRLESAGVLRAASKRGALPVWSPRSVQGTPLSRTIAMGREDA
ncbi:MAG: type II toxin-antitoxin system prevent-host-death family antitoxin [Nitrospira sp. CG24D]|jgi:prevent-host-death family protein|nr:MAG: type II toxin-antitoxin system prevent-host-death family antitoxin [Nitrospira sp. CG24D]